MKSALVLGLALMIAAPVVHIPTPADAQVLVGGARRSAPRPRPRLSEAEQDRLESAEDEMVALDEKLADLEAANEASGGLTEAQRAEWQNHTARRQEAQATVERLRAKRNG
ncbi:hypothetical protein ACIQTU_05085 [Brevundimonas sp. NPDC090276]|uniref:hypothetical protein n=1 Tax=Brevundimonas sp. NPDC090276 TaxID=3363956 RepID=UPI00383AB05D